MTPNARATCKNEGVLVSYNYDNSVSSGPIVLTLRMHEGIHLAMYFHVSQLGCFCTCARARVVPRSRERLNRLRSNLVQRLRPVSRVACPRQLGPTLHVHGVTVPDLKNGWADCVQIWCMGRERLVGCHASQLEAQPRRSARAGLNPSLARFSPLKASYWYLLLSAFMYYVSCINI